MITEIQESEASIKSSDAKQNEAIYQLKISLVGSKPLIWRRFTIKNTVTLQKLHQILQVIMGWEDYHLYKFEKGKRQHTIIYSLPDESGPLFGDWLDLPPEEDVRKTLLKDALFEEKQKLTYFYDMGDYWEHAITLEKVLPLENSGKISPVCLKAAGACPPEDFGGICCYQDFVEALGDTKHPEHKEAQERLEERLYGEFDPKAYDKDEVNQELKKIKV